MNENQQIKQTAELDLWRASDVVIIKSDYNKACLSYLKKNT